MPRSSFNLRTTRVRSRRGFVLVMTLVILAIAVATLVQLADRSLSLVQTARASELDLQEKWATLSLRLRLIGPAETVLGDYAAQMEAEGQGWPHPASVQGEIKLGGARYSFVVADEQAKTNLNALYDERPDLALGLLAQAAHEAGASLPIKLRPKPALRRSSRHRHFENWGQLVDLAAMSPAAGDANALMSLAHDVTCWGNGRMNLTRASDAALIALAGLELNATQASGLIEARQGFAGELDDLLDQVDIPRRKRAALRRRLTDRSSCYTLWLIRENKQGQSLTLVVDQRGRRDAPATQVYQWP